MQATSSAKGTAAANMASTGNAGGATYASDEDEESLVNAAAATSAANTTSNTRRVVNAGLARLRLTQNIRFIEYSVYLGLKIPDSSLALNI